MSESSTTPEHLQQLIEYLEGTCKSLSEACDEHGLDSDKLTTADHERIDDAIFECATCNWWYATDQLAESENGENICIECHCE